MITTVFAFGNYDKTKHRDPIVGDSEDAMYNYALLLLLAVVVCVPIMLCAKPLLFLMGQKRSRLDEQGHIELVSMDGKRAGDSVVKVDDEYRELVEDQENEQ